MRTEGKKMNGMRWTCKDGKNRRDKLNRLQAVGFRGVISVCAPFACDKYAISDSGVAFCGRVKYGKDGFLKPNFSAIYSALVTHNRTEYGKEAAEC